MKPQQILIGVLLLSAAGLGAFLVFGGGREGGNVLSGYVEGEPLYPASPVSGRLVALDVQRGDTLTAGTRFFSVDPAQTQAVRDQAAAEAQAARSLAADARRGQRPAELGVIEAQLAAARAVLNEADTSLKRVQPLAEAGAASRAQLDSAIAARATATANVRAIEKQLQAAQLGAREDQAQAAQDRVSQAEAALGAAEARLTDLSPQAPAAGRVEDVFFQPGEWVQANQPVLSFIPDDRVRLRFFAPQDSIAAYAIGAEVGFGCDGCAEGLKAKITYVSPRPEFTPPVIYSREARERMVFLVEAVPASSKGLTPGQPIDVTPLKAAAK
ncbi:MAG TPA: HlyD family efflux transporter periplasmic adaptor subunit [Hyphomonadaceae bacterium]|nr:HlyD family efflux transporter periplasmic adaptor subunit [Hyphomonadaceae bacterium]